MCILIEPRVGEITSNLEALLRLWKPWIMVTLV